MGNGSTGEQLAANSAPVRKANSNWRGTVCELGRRGSLWLTAAHCTRRSTAEHGVAPRLFWRRSGQWTSRTPMHSHSNITR
ncbi:hypothetical protein NDU88_003129 [Pleurodeles waltl]|uniref:Uncharacterized protein n=1 Tax=Pleurodeles waltl TaxID=8319 RepID=A0AAV7M7X7_PLEWA|nr:hypothetical protein NDU88_003129 [Pleurodeles waltl]